MDYKKMYEETMKAYESLLVKTLEKATDDDLKQLDVLKKRMEEFEAQMAMEDRKLPAQPKEETLTESQKWTRKLVEAISTRSTYSASMPKEMAKSVIEKIGQYANLVSKVTVYNMVSDVAMPVEAGLPAVAYVTDGTAIGETNENLSFVTLSPKMIGCIARLSNVLVADLSFDFVGYVEGAIARAIANKLDYEIIQGAGTTAITGVLTASGIKTATSATTLTLTWDEVRKAMSKLKGYKANCTVVVGQEVADIIHGFKDSAGTYIFPQNEELKSIMGHEVVISDQMPEVAAKKCLFIAGDFKQYVLGQREDVEVQLLYERYAEYNQTGIKTTCRYDGNVAQPEAFSVIISA